MLDRLPHEVILQVCDYLSLRPKLNLAMTCRAFYAKLYNSKLFENLVILSKNKGTVIKLLHDKKIDTSRIKTFHIISPTQEDSRATEMLALFPKAQEFALENPYIYTFGSSTAGSFEHLSYLKDTIKKLNNLHSFPVITQLLKVYTFPHLTSLCLEGSPTDQTNNPLVCLTNTPNLISLELNSCRISIGFLEQLHDKCRRLQSLKLGRGTLDLVSQTLPELIDPANELISFTSTLFVINDIPCHFFRYIIAKYPNLRSFDINNWLDMPQLYARRGYVTYIVSNTHKAYRQNLHALMMELLPRLTTLNIEPYLFSDFFDTIATNQARLDSLCIYGSNNRFDFFQRMKKSHTFLATLNHLSSLTVEIKYAQHLYRKKYQYPNIKELHLFQSRAWIHIPTFELDKILLTYNGLRTFIFKCPHVNLDPGDIDDTIQYPNLHHLTINAFMSTDDTWEYVNQCLPNVTDIYWRNSRMDSQSYEVNLPNHSLNVLNFGCNPMHRVQADTPLFIYHIQKEDISKTVEVFKVGQNHKVKEKVDDIVAQNVKQEDEPVKVEVKEEEKEIHVKDETEASTLDAENRLHSTYINITCKNIRELHCGDLVIF